MKFKSILYIFLMTIFLVFAYLLLNSGINAKTKVYVNYKNESDVIYKVYLKDSKNPLGMNDRYTASLVDKINLNFKVNSTFSESVNGFYRYNIEGILVIYTDDITDSLYQKKHILLSDIVNPLNNNNNFVNMEQDIDIFLNEYEEKIKKIAEEYNEDVNGYFEVRFNALESLNFNDINNTKELTNQIKVIIPLNHDKFKINVVNDKKRVDSYYDFSKRQPVNYLLMLLGSLSFSIGIAFLSLVVRNMIILYKKENKYNKELKGILKTHANIIVNVKKFYNKKKYNLIYVTSFQELMDVYNKVGNPISFKEIKKNNKAIFLLIEDNNAWIYKMNRDNLK